MNLRYTLPALALLATTALQAQRLPANAHPQHYNLALTPDLKAGGWPASEHRTTKSGAPHLAFEMWVPPPPHKI